MKIFLDDIRHPQNCLSYMYQRIGKNNLLYLEEWVIARDYKEFVKAIEDNYEKIEYVSFDHDLSLEHYIDGDRGKIQENYTEKTGADCAKWMKEFYHDKGQPLPICFIHSMNPIGCERIANILRI